MNNDIRGVIRAYGIGFVGAMILALFAYCFAVYVNAFHYLTKTYIEMINIIKFIPAATALYGRKGWDI